MKFKLTSYDDIDGIIEESIEESARVDTCDISESINVTFDIISKKLKEFFDEQA
tara:strand:- start:895 stop:1056 length:162 start_codon:yes stop_codon:yes gene_type:complete